MLKGISFSNYKCLDNKSFEFGEVNLFSGYNGRGKSSVIQAILMLSQSIDKSNANSLEKLHLNGPLVNLGDFDEILADISSEDKWTLGIEMVIDSISNNHKISFGYSLSDDFKVGIMSKCIIDNDDYFDVAGKALGSDSVGGASSESLTKQLPLYINQLLARHNLHFVSAGRRGPVKFEEKLEIPENYCVSTDGSTTINTMASYKDMVDARLNVDSLDNTQYSLVESVTRWTSFIMNGGAVSVKGRTTKDSILNQTKSSVLSLGFNIGDSLRSFNSYNVGFGYSYILPIVVTALIAKPGNIVIVENPEAHLHPEAQLNLTFLLAKLAGIGVQVFIETHSEHVVNGLRLAVLKPEYTITSDNVRMYFFDSDYSIKQLRIESNGRVLNWPRRFFDQYQNELAEILKLGARRIQDEG